MSEQVAEEERQARRRLRGKQPAPAWAAGGGIAKAMEEQKEVVEAEMIIGVVVTDLSRAPNAGVRWLTPLSRERREQEGERMGGRAGPLACELEESVVGRKGVIE